MLDATYFHPNQNLAVCSPSLFSSVSHSQSIKVCLRTPSPSSRVLRPSGRARLQPDALQHLLTPTWAPTLRTLRPLGASRGSKTPLILEKLLARRLVPQPRGFRRSKSIGSLIFPCLFYPYFSFSVFFFNTFLSFIFLSVLSSYFLSGLPDE